MRINFNSIDSSVGIGNSSTVFDKSLLLLLLLLLIADVL